MDRDFNNTLVAIIGCGSVGGYLSLALAELGIKKFLLMDNDILKPENTYRHLCDLVDAADQPKKVAAVKNKLIRRFPDIDVTTSDEDILNYLVNDDGQLNQCDFIICAVGKYSVERRMNFLAKKGSLKAPIAYVWVEPYAVAGHLLFIDSQREGCFQCCFNEDANFLYSVSEHNPPRPYVKREAGCQSSYLPYRSLEAEQFTIEAAKKVANLLAVDCTENQLFTWLGDTDSFVRNGFTITERYINKQSYIFYPRKIESSKYCEFCQ